MRKILILAVVAASIGGGLTLRSQNAPEQEGKEVQRVQTNGETARFILDTEPLDRTDRAISYAPVIEQATPAVVTVASSSMVRVLRNRYANPMEEFLKRFYGLPSPQGPNPNSQEAPPETERRVPNGLGSGVIISPDGYILTNNHVVTDQRGQEADEITVTLTDDREYTAKLVGRDPRTDVALLKIEGEALPYLTMADSDQIMVGDVVFAIGNPMGLAQTVTMGIVSATGRSRLGILGTEGYENFIQTDASINPGNSGGALIDAEGRLIGINTAIYSRTGGNIGIGFAIPITLARSIVVNLIETGTVQRGFLGVSIADLDPDLAEAFNLKSTRGALVQGIQEGGPAEEAGMKVGDVIIRINGRDIGNVSDLRLQVAQTPPGTVVKMDVMREGEELNLDVTLGSQDASADEDLGKPGAVLEGITLQPVNEDLQSRFSIEERSGLLVTEIDPASPFAQTLAQGMVIISINDHPVESVNDAREALRKGVNKLWVSYRGNRGFLALRIP